MFNYIIMSHIIGLLLICMYSNWQTSVGVFIITVCHLVIQIAIAKKLRITANNINKK
jgi:uncharacterized membrane protein